MSIRPDCNGMRPSWLEDPNTLHAIESALTPEQYEGLHRARGLDGEIAPDEWLGVPALAQVYGYFAALNIVAELQESDPRRPDEGQAIRIAAERLKIPAKTIRNWRRQWRNHATRWASK